VAVREYELVRAEASQRQGTRDGRAERVPGRARLKRARLEASPAAAPDGAGGAEPRAVGLESPTSRRLRQPGHAEPCRFGTRRVAPLTLFGGTFGMLRSRSYGTPSSSGRGCSSARISL
jgi:hypothetical protein